jgi:hypothetical protein
VLPIEENRELLSLGHMFCHQAQDAFITVDEEVRAAQLRKARNDTDGRQGHKVDQCASPVAAGCLGVRAGRQRLRYQAAKL